MKRWVVVTDVDGTLLDAETYSWAPAAETIRELAARSIPVVLCTSKTRAELEVLRAELRITDPFIVENGGAIVWSANEMIVLGAPYSKILAALRTAPGVVRGFSQMALDELARDAGIPIERAALAKARDYDEPFHYEGDAKLLEAYLAAHGLAVSRGGRFWHAHGVGADKGAAVRKVLELYGDARSLGLGDSALDLPLLTSVETAVAIAKPDGTVDPALGAFRRTRAAGPEGWAEAVREIVLT